MKQTQFQMVVILSAELSNTTARSNGMRTLMLEEKLLELGITYNVAQGCYKGSTETSFVCLPKGMGEYYKLKDIAFKVYDQESILIQGYSGESSLVYQDDTIVKLGKLRLVPESVAKNQDGYTFMNGQYYSIVA